MTWQPEFSRKLRVERMMLRQTDKIIAFSDYSAGPSGGQYDAYT